MHPFGKILILIALLGTGMVFASLGVFVIALAQGYELAELMDLVRMGDGNYTTALLRGTLWMQAIFGFLLPACVFVLLFYKTSWRIHLGLQRVPGLMVSLVAVVALFAALPLVQLAYEANMALPLPEWMHSLEESAAEVMRDILVMESVGGFLLTLLLVAVLPAIGEELVFRGILQTQIAEWTRRPVLSVWIAAIVFSAIHMQFEGFLPRMVLGAVLGLLYLWTKNLWVPILAHAVNNGFQVAVLYFAGVDLSDMDQESPVGLNWWVVVGSIGILYICYRVLRKPNETYA